MDRAEQVGQTGGEERLCCSWEESGRMMQLRKDTKDTSADYGLAPTFAVADGFRLRSDRLVTPPFSPDPFHWVPEADPALDVSVSRQRYSNDLQL